MKLNKIFWYHRTLMSVHFYSFFAWRNWSMLFSSHSMQLLWLTKTTIIKKFKKIILTSFLRIVLNFKILNFSRTADFYNPITHVSFAAGSWFKFFGHEPFELEATVIVRPRRHSGVCLLSFLCIFLLSLRCPVKREEICSEWNRSFLRHSIDRKRAPDRYKTHSNNWYRAQKRRDVVLDHFVR